VIIIVGSDAAAMDIVSATMLAAKIGAMTSTTSDNLVMLDTELDFATWKAICDSNLILIGGPVANTIVEQLVENGISTADWAISPGGWELIEAPYGGCDILIVAGADRDATRAAVQYLIDIL
jgi:S-layer protein (TIGR01564 family)